MYVRALAAVIAFGTLSACAISPKDFESQPVLVDTAMGPVICQLYTPEQVTWDRSIGRPNAMDVATADTICRNEGKRIIQGGEPVYAPTTTDAAATEL
ncbi:hypothetical protein [Paracoccus sp. SCSIO 75233]|uniref:hypothetical protein n=1 Tax=Paracoccus sp. SCSIO 75233 TaxID=3017782 RepID=UPI0022F126DA|nr:hypothetical protein [Paracoccus sp. SCSIO 75233]WBU54144.1 hypothetical protein PAF12_04740 [Paracoccus sp. SCSIO 75233]